MIPKLSPPIRATLGTMLAKLEGIAMIVGIIWPLKVTPSSEWICLDMMMMPIPANMPCTTLNGNMLVSLPILANPMRIWIPPQTTPTASAYRKPAATSTVPSGVMPNSCTAPYTMAIRPAAAPLMVTKEPPNREPSMPPRKPVITPAMGGAPEAIAMPRLKGKAMRNRIKPEITSVLAFCLSPGR